LEVQRNSGGSDGCSVDDVGVGVGVGGGVGSGGVVVVVVVVVTMMVVVLVNSRGGGGKLSEVSPAGCRQQQYTHMKEMLSCNNHSGDGKRSGAGKHTSPLSFVG
jgi:hypothetical protein